MNDRHSIDLSTLRYSEKISPYFIFSTYGRNLLCSISEKMAFPRSCAPFKVARARSQLSTKTKLKKIEFWCQVTGRALKWVLECVNEMMIKRELYLISSDRNRRLNFWWSNEIMEVFTFSAAKKDAEIFRSAPINPIILTLLRTEKQLGRSSLVCWLLCCLIDSCN
jgi:hypothetical protein